MVLTGLVRFVVDLSKLSWFLYSGAVDGVIFLL